MKRLKGIEALKYMLSKRQDDLQRLYNENADQLSIDLCASTIESIRDKIKAEEGQFWCKHPDENGNKIPMTKVEGSSVMSEEEVEELNKIKLPF
jgi:hypothetical protein